MSNPVDSSMHTADDTLQNTRLARGLRAVAATLIVGGIVIAAMETGAPESRTAPGDGASSVIQPGAATGVVTPAAISPDARPAGGAEPLLDRIDRAMEQHG